MGWHAPLAHWPRWRKWVISIVVLAGAFVGAVALEIHRDGTYFFVSCNLNRLQPHGPGRSSYLYSADGVRFATLGAPVVHTAVPLAQIDSKLQQATIAVEDRRFYHHWGIDPRGIARAAWHNLRAGGVREGGSTITQQLAKTVFLSPERNLSRKMR